MEDVVVVFSPEEWALLNLAQKKLYKDVMIETFKHLESVGEISTLPGSKNCHQHQREYSGHHRRRSLCEKTGGNHYGTALTQIPHLGVRQRSVPGVNNFAYRERGEACMDAVSCNHHTRSSNGRGGCQCQNEGQEAPSSPPDVQPLGAAVNEKEPQMRKAYGGKEVMDGSAFKMPLSTCLESEGNVNDRHQSSSFRSHERSQEHVCEEHAEMYRPSSPLVSHRTSKDKSKTDRCIEQGDGFTEIPPFTQRMENQSRDLPYEWKAVGKPFSRSFIPQQVLDRSHSPQCQQCGQSLKSPPNLNVQKRSHIEETPCNCVECENGFTHHLALTGHTQTHCECEKFGKSLNSTSHPNSRKAVHSRKRPSQCGECGKSFNRASSLQIHMRSHTGERPYQCQECGKSFNRASSLRVHFRTHTGERPYRCEECGQSFIHALNLHIHIRTHTGERPYQCKECGQAFIRASHLRVHLRTHTGERPNECKECGKSFNFPADLRAHMRSHTGERPYQCQECGKAFIGTSSLHVHMRTHSGEKKPYECKKCGKSFSKVSSLQVHMRSHTGERPYQCKDCGKSYTESSTLRDHMRTHTGERPHQCKECGKSFRRSSHLHVHMRTHTGEKPHRCKECGKSFSQASHLQRHSGTHSRERPF